MSSSTYKVTVSPVPLICGTILWASGTALLCEEAWHAGSLTVQSAMMPVLTSSAVAAGVMAHVRLMQWRVVSAVLFAVLTLLGSVLCVAGTLGRVAGHAEQHTATVNAANATYQRKVADLQHAKAEQARECKTRGKRCASWDERVDTLTGELDSRVTVSADPRADAIVRVAVLFGADAGYTRQLIAALDAPSLPLYIELGALVFLGAAFHPRKRNLSEHIPTLDVESSQKVLSRNAALVDFRRLGETGAQKVLAHRWGVSESCVSKWLGSWEHSGLVNRRRSGKERPVLALPPPR